MSRFTKEQLAYYMKPLEEDEVWEEKVVNALAEFALTLLEEAELSEYVEAERDRLKCELREASGAIIWLAAVKMFNAVPPDQVSAAITRARERSKR